MENSLSIIIPALNEEKYLPQTFSHLAPILKSLKNSGWEVEVVVCDNGSSDQTPQIASSFGARVVLEPIKQISRSRNRGGFEALGHFLIFLDADSHPSKKLVYQTLKVLKKGKTIGGGSHIAPDFPTPTTLLTLRLWNRVSSLFGVACGAYIFCSRGDFLRVGGFSLEMFAGEEIDFSRKLKKLGKKSGRRFTILEKSPLITSTRKFNLYSPFEILWLIFQAVFLPWKVVLEPQPLWYDGRR